MYRLEQLEYQQCWGGVTFQEIYCPLADRLDWWRGDYVA